MLLNICHIILSPMARIAIFFGKDFDDFSKSLMNLARIFDEFGMDSDEFGKDFDEFSKDSDEGNNYIDDFEHSHPLGIVSSPPAGVWQGASGALKVAGRGLSKTQTNCHRNNHHHHHFS